MALSSAVDPQAAYANALFIAHIQSQSCPHGFPDNDFRFGQRRAQWIELENVKRAEQGRELMENDEEGNPELTRRRRDASIEALIGKARVAGKSADQYGVAEAEEEIEGLEDQLQGLYDRYKAAVAQ